jgi:hypothetical protein
MIVSQISGSFRPAYCNRKVIEKRNIHDWRGIFLRNCGIYPKQFAVKYSSDLYSINWS